MKTKIIHRFWMSYIFKVFLSWLLNLDMRYTSNAGRITKKRTNRQSITKSKWRKLQENFWLRSPERNLQSSLFSTCGEHRVCLGRSWSVYYRLGQLTVQSLLFKITGARGLLKSMKHVGVFGGKPNYRDYLVMEIDLMPFCRNAHLI